jgi:hypothetical protein
MNKTSVTHNPALAKASRAVFKVTLPCVPYNGAGQNGVDATAVDTWNGLPSAPAVLERSLI